MTKHYNKKSELGKRRFLRKEQTFAEKVVWIYLRKKQILNYKFRRQYSIDQYVIDFYCPKLKFAVEIDGETHNKPEQKDYDNKREKYLMQYNISFIRLSNDELLGNPDKAFKKIEEAIKIIEDSLDK